MCLLSGIYQPRHRKRNAKGLTSAKTERNKATPVSVRFQSRTLRDSSRGINRAGEIWASPFNACLTHVKLGMPSLPVGDVYIHPDATSSMIPHLKAHLPPASTELYVVQVPPAPDSTVFPTFPPAESPPKSRDWVVGALGITGMSETELWFWSSVEERPQ